MVTGGDNTVVAMLIVAERDFFMPCGGCLDWVFELGSGSTLIGFQSQREAQVELRYARELMPHYPR